MQYLVSYRAVDDSLSCSSPRCLRTFLDNRRLVAIMPSTLGSVPAPTGGTDPGRRADVSSRRRHRPGLFVGGSLRPSHHQRTGLLDMDWVWNIER